MLRRGGLRNSIAACCSECHACPCLLQASGFHLLSILAIRVMQYHELYPRMCVMKVMISSRFRVSVNSSIRFPPVSVMIATCRFSIFGYEGMLLASG